jgi:hypothetical protein
VHLAAATTGDESEEQRGQRFLDLLTHDKSSVSQWTKGQCILPEKRIIIPSMNLGSKSNKPGVSASCRRSGSSFPPKVSVVSADK